MERIMNEENEWDQSVQADSLEGPVERVSREEVGKMEAGKAAGPSKVSVEMLVASGEIGIDLMVELCQSMLDGRGIPDEWALSVVVPIFKGKGDAMNCGAYRGVKLLQHAMKIVEKVLGRRMRHMVKVDEMQFGFMPQRNNRCSVHFKEVTRGVLGQGEEVVTSRLEMPSTYNQFSKVKKKCFVWLGTQRSWHCLT